MPGDIAVVQMGDIVPADAKILSGALSVDQSALTGESLPVEVGPSDILYSSSVVKRGEAQCLVVNTGADTYFGRTAELVQTARPKSHQEQIMLSIVRYMMYLGIAALAAVAVGRPADEDRNPGGRHLCGDLPHGRRARWPFPRFSPSCRR